MLIVYPPYTFSSNLQKLNKAKFKNDKRWQEDFELTLGKAMLYVE